MALLDIMFAKYFVLLLLLCRCIQAAEMLEDTERRLKAIQVVGCNASSEDAQQIRLSVMAWEGGTSGTQKSVVCWKEECVWSKELKSDALCYLHQTAQGASEQYFIWIPFINDERFICVAAPNETVSQNIRAYLQTVQPQVADLLHNSIEHIQSGVNQLLTQMTSFLSRTLSPSQSFDNTEGTDDIDS